jgi:predicted nuclease of predicted toxin-antitoxin system
LNILLDESVPRLIKTQLSEFPITTVQEMGWSGMKNGELIAAAEQQFTTFITADQQLRYQQNLTGRKLSIIVLPTNQVPLVTTLLPSIREAIAKIQPGVIIEVPFP